MAKDDDELEGDNDRDNDESGLTKLTVRMTRITATSLVTARDLTDC